MLLGIVVACLLFFSNNTYAQQTTAAQPTEKTEEQLAEEKPKQQDTATRSAAMTAGGDSAAGSIGGIKSPESVKVSSGGGASQSIPIVVPPGTAGVQPNLSLNYNSQGENSLLGVGWSVSGLPIIHRCPRTVAQDGVRGGVNYDANDRFCLDGQRLMATSGTYGANGTEYRTEIDSFLKIISYGTAGNGPAYFVVKSKGGETMEFGGNASSDQGRIEAEAKASVRVWALSKSSDVKGNYFAVTYAEDSANGEYRPTQIDYTGNTAGLTPNRSVTLEYITRTDQIPQWVGGSKILTTKLLSSVKTYVGGAIPGNLVRDYRMTYEEGTVTKRSRLKTITECDKNGNCLPAGTPSSPASYTFTYQEGGNNTFTPTTFNISDPQFDDTKVWLGDYNGDGKHDFLSYKNGSVWAHLSDGAGSYTPAGTTIVSAHFTGTKVWIGDFNGDGRTDFATFNNATVYTYLAKADGSATFDKISFGVLAANFDSDYVWTADINGDGRTDLVTRNNNQLHTYLSNFVASTGNFNSPVSFGVPDSQFDRNKISVGDFNGDGLQDLRSYNSSNGTLWVHLSNGTGTSWTAVSTSVGTANFSADNWTGDFNGDGVTDLAAFNNGKLYTYLSKGDGTFIGSFITPSSGQFDRLYTWAIDANGDGRTDLLSRENNQIHAYYSKGDGNYWVVSTTTNDWQFDRTKVWPADYSGDGKGDLASWKNGEMHTHAAHINSPTDKFPDLLVSILNPFGGTNTITYKPLTDNTVYAKDTGAQAAVYPNVDLQYPVYVVSDLTVSDGLGSNYNSSYTYGGAKAHYLGRGGLGFRWTTAVDGSANSKTTTFFKQGFPLTGLADTVEIDRNSDGAPFVETINTYLTGSAPSTPTVIFVGSSQQDTIQYDGGGTSRTTRRTFEYDSFANGNQTRAFHHGDISISGDERDERLEWIVDSTNWLHRPKRQAIYSGGGALVREKWLYYDSQAHGVLGSAGLLTKEEANAGGGIGHANNPTVTHAYDASFGVKTSTTDGRGCTTTIAYEATKTFPQTVTNCLTHQSTLVYDARFGVKLSGTDANNQATTYEYDGFGRLKKAIGPLDSSTHPTVSQDYLDWGNPTLQRVVTYRREQHGTANVIWTEEYFDGLGRGDQTRQEGPGGQVIISDKTIDSRGLVLSATAPHFSTETPVTATYEYDVLGRQTKITNPDGTFETAAYTPGMVTLTDERGKVKRKYADAFGQLSRVDEVNGSETYVTTYAYDAAGSLTTVINHLGHTTRMAYDMLGRKIAMCDPNMGTASGVSSCTTGSVGAWVYTYNKAGDLLTQKDAKNQTLTFTYDSLGRPLTKKQGTTSLVTWTYDDPVVVYSKGKVTQIVDQATTTKFAYDQLGRTTQTQRQLLGVWHTMSQQYDALNRIISETFPDSETVNYTYNEAGWLSSVSGYINGITYNARGQKTALTYANNLTTTWTFNANNFRVTNRTTSNNQQNLTYGYDNNGNITSITDSLFTGSRTFGYDDLNRLTSASGTFGPNQSVANCTYGYNAIGDITNKCGTTFTYGDSMHPSAVTFNPATGRNYTYDANGNMLTRGNQTLAWDIDNRVSSVAISGGGTTLMEYDYTGIRVKKNAPTGISLYPFQGYEIDPSGTITKFIRIGIENFASKRGANKYFYHNDHLGGVNVITDIAGTRVQLNEYDPWGGVSKTVGSIDPTHRFTGKELDPESGLYYYGGRYYDPEISRFISPDPFIQQPDNPQSLNRYSYVLNNPQNYIDPSGYFFGKLFKAIAKLFKTIAKVFTTYVVPVLQIAVGAVLLATGNPAGALLMASGALSFCKSSGCQLGSRITGFLAAAWGGLQTDSGGGGIPFLSFNDDGPLAGGTGSGGSWDPSALWGKIATFVYGEIQATTKKTHQKIENLEFVKRGRELATVARREAILTQLPGLSQGEADAWRHARWNQLMAEEMGPFKALLVSMGHEIFENQVTGDQTWADFRMDMHNNIVGAVSGKHPDILLRDGRLTTILPRKQGVYHTIGATR